MTLTLLSVSNLKCFVDLRLELAPLTVLTGLNSAGKSTALQAILLLAQGLRMDNGSGPLSLNGSLVRLGSAADVLASSATDREISLAVSSAKESVHWRFGPVDTSAAAISVFNADFSNRKGAHRNWAGQLWRPRRVDATPDLISTLKTVINISAVRSILGDAFPVPDDVGLVNADVGKEGQYAPAWYVGAADDEIPGGRRHPTEPATSLRRQMDAYFSDLFPGGQATADEIVRASLVRLSLRLDTTSDWRRPANVGYGLTYAFPLLVAMLLAKSGQIIIIDSPEAHLHPRAQSRMGSILARIAAAGVQILIETHSDHVLNGIRLAVREKTIPHTSVAMHFFGGAKLAEHGVISPQLDRNGAIDAWPSGFFDQSEKDLATLAGWG